MIIFCGGGGFNFLWVIDRFMVLLKVIYFFFENLNTYNFWFIVLWDLCIFEVSL